MVINEALIGSSKEVLTIFLIPFGGGIPAGVVLAQARGLEWPLMMLLYFISDLILACVFEPIMHMFIRKMEKTPRLKLFMEEYKKSLIKSGIKLSSHAGPFSLIGVSIGVDPMTGRVAAKTAGHGFISGWAIAITGDMIFFSLIMASTLWLNNLLGNGALTAIIIMIAMIGLPMLIDKIRSTKKINTNSV